MIAALALGLAAPAFAQSLDELFEAALDASDLGDYVRALELAELAALQKHAPSAKLAGRLLASGDVGAIDDAGAARWFRIAADAGDAEAAFALGLYALHDEAGLTRSQAPKWLEAAAEGGVADAIHELARYYAVEGDAAKARTYFEQAAEAGAPGAERELGLMLIERSEPEDRAEGLRRLEAAADTGDVEAAYAAGLAYAQGIGGEASVSKSAGLLQQAADAGHAAAAADFGLLIYTGDGGVPASREEGAQWFRRAAQSGDPRGQLFYATALAFGQGEAQNFAEAYRWVLRSEAQGPMVDAVAEERRRQLKLELVRALGSERAAVLDAEIARGG